MKIQKSILFRYIVPITNLKMTLKSTIYNSIKTPLLVGLIFKRQTHKQDQVYKKFIGSNTFDKQKKRKWEQSGKHIHSFMLICEGRETMNSFLGRKNSASNTALKKSRPDQWGIPEQSLTIGGILHQAEMGQLYYNSSVDWEQRWQKCSDGSKKKGKSWGCQSAVLLVVGLLQGDLSSTLLQLS